VRFTLGEPQSPAAHSFFVNLLDGLTPHLKACGIARPDGSRKFMVIEDFETTGLKGAIDRKDDGQFCGFWRGSAARTRKGHRAAMGARQAGVLVVVIDKDINLIGLTRRTDYPEACLMGQAILKNHGINGLKAIATIERRMREDERPQPKRKKMRVRRRRDSNDDD
jgi:hypothetical protein